MMPSERMPQADSLVDVAPLEWLTRAAVRFPLATLFIAAVASAASIWLDTTNSASAPAGPNC